MAIKKPAKSNKSSSSSTDRKSSLADLWDETDSSEASNNLPEGEHEVRIDSMLLKEDKKKGTAVFVQYSAIEGEHEGKGLRQMYKLTDADGNKSPGLAYLMQSLELIGYKDIKGAKLKKTLQEITEEQPIVVIKAKENGQYMNAYLLGTPEDVEGKGEEEEEEDESEGEDSEIEVGNSVTFTDPDDEDETLEGTVESINEKKGTAKIKVGKKSYVVDVDDLTSVESEVEEEEEEKPAKKGKGKGKTEPEEEEEEEEEEENAEIVVKDEVMWTDEDDDEMTGIVSKITGSTATVKDEDGDMHKVKLSKLTKVD